MSGLRGQTGETGGGPIMAKIANSRRSRRDQSALSVDVSVGCNRLVGIVQAGLAEAVDEDIMKSSEKFHFWKLARGFSG